MKIIEGWGTGLGLGRIRNSCGEYGLKDPLTDEYGDGVRVVFFRKTIRANRKEDNGDVTGRNFHFGE